MSAGHPSNINDVIITTITIPTITIKITKITINTIITIELKLSL